MTTGKPLAPTILNMYCTGGTEMAQSHTWQPAIRTLSGVDQKILSFRREPMLRALVAQVRCLGFDSPFPFPLSSLLNIYNSSLFQHKTRVLSIKTWEGKMCFHEDKFRLTCMASQAFKHAFSIRRTLASCWNLDVMRRR